MQANTYEKTIKLIIKYNREKKEDYKFKIKLNIDQILLNKLLIWMKNTNYKTKWFQIKIFKFLHINFLNKLAKESQMFATFLKIFIFKIIIFTTIILWVNHHLNLKLFVRLLQILKKNNIFFLDKAKMRM